MIRIVGGMTREGLVRLAGNPQVAGFMAVVLAGLALHWSPLVTTTDLAVLDRQFRFLRATALRPVATDVVIVGIDEETTRVLAEPIALWHRHLGRFLEAMAQARPSVVGVDISLPDRSYDFVLAGQDTKLLRGIVALRGVAPVVLGLTVDADGRVRRIFPPFVATAGRGAVGFVLLPLDPDRVVRRFSGMIAEGDREIPTLVGQMARRLGIEPRVGLIDYAVGETFDYVPLHDVLARYADGDIEALRRAFGGRPVLLGSVLPFIDRQYQPVNLAAWEENDSFAPSVLAHAQALRSLMGPGLVTEAPGVAVLALVLLASVCWWLAATPLAGIASFAGFALPAAAASTWLLSRGVHLPVAAPLLTGGLAAAGRVALQAGLQVLERRRLRRAFGGYVSPQIMAEIVEGRLAAALGGERRTICVLFSDVRGFTTRSEGMAPEDVVVLLNRYFEGMITAIHEQEGTVDKLMGDGIMAFFGAPNRLDDPCRKAFDAARDMLVRLDALNAEFEAEAVPPIEIGIGLHLGEAVVGHVGSAARHEYSAIGDVVNVASRIEGLTKEVGYPLVCSGEVVNRIGNTTGFVSLGAKPIKGHTPISVYGWPQRQGGAPSAGTA